jgi:hypothetical protein
MTGIEGSSGGENMFTEEQGAKSLNVAANLVALSEGKGVVGISADDVKNIFEVSGEKGHEVLNIKDYEEFNKLVGKLNGHAQGLWEKGVLQKGAVAFLDDIKKDTWEDIIEANGLEEQIEGYDIEPGQIKDFEKSDVVNDAEKLLEKVKQVKENLLQTETPPSSNSTVEKPETTINMPQDSVQEKVLEKIQEMKMDGDVYNAVKNMSVEEFLNAKAGNLGLDSGIAERMDSLRSFREGMDIVETHDAFHDNLNQPNNGSFKTDIDAIQRLQEDLRNAGVGGNSGKTVEEVLREREMEETDIKVTGNKAEEFLIKQDIEKIMSLSNRQANPEIVGEMLKIFNSNENNLKLEMEGLLKYIQHDSSDGATKIGDNLSYIIDSKTSMEMNEEQKNSIGEIVEGIKNKTGNQVELKSQLEEHVKAMHEKRLVSDDALKTVTTVGGDRNSVSKTKTETGGD